MVNMIINGDDFGISSGVNQAIVNAYNKGVLNSTSLMVNMNHVDEAMKMLREQTDGKMKVGLHLNFTVGKSLSKHRDIPMLVDEEGNFNCGFVKLLFYSMVAGKELAKQMEKELRAQVEAALERGVVLSHIDSHRHIHTIPLLNKIVKKIAKEYGIPRVRVINENILHTLKDNKNFSFLLDGGIIKYLLISSFEFINKSKSNTYFYSVLYTGKLDKNKVRHFTVDESKYKNLEVMMHPSITKVDIDSEDAVPDYNLVLNWRDLEFAALLDKNLWKCN